MSAEVTAAKAQIARERRILDKLLDARRGAAGTASGQTLRTAVGGDFDATLAPLVERGLVVKDSIDGQDRYRLADARDKAAAA